MTDLAARALASFVVSIVLTALIVTVLGDVVDHLRGVRGLPTCRRAGRDLLAVARWFRDRSRR